ncbi:MAG: trans-2-enoyl-CoA reductase family protein [Clostridia bacterium]|nr:trans-2-enoyl-CoA reductase family protein [Clostridia bacterium]
MIVEPKTRGFICTTAHPAGCAVAVNRQIDYVKSQPRIDGPKKVLVIGASTGYGLASRISAAFASSAATIGVIFDKPAGNNRTASAGWYNSAAFEQRALAEGLYAKTVNGDAFSAEVKDQVIQMIREDLGSVDLIVYSLASPRRTLADGTVYNSVLKTTSGDYENKTIDLRTNAIVPVAITPATPEEVEATVKVMGGEDWQDWLSALDTAGLLAPQTVTIAYSYIGPQLTHPIYLNGSIGQAKRHLYETAKAMTREMSNVKAYVSVNKALVTQASAAIPVVPLYISILYKVMKEMNVHEGCIEQMYRLFKDKLYGAGEAGAAGTPFSPVLDEAGYLRVDDWEMRPDVQQAVDRIWPIVATENAADYCDIVGYWDDFFQMFGFRQPGIDYATDVEIDVPIPSIPVEDETAK